MTRTSVSAVLFDLDSTLCEHPVSRADALDAAFRRAGVDPFFSMAEFRREIESFGETVSMPYRTYRCCERLAAEAGRDPEVGVAVAAALQVERRHADATLSPGAETVLDRLGEQYPLALVTNGGPDTQVQKIDALGIADYFDEIVLAGFDAPSKPDPEPFQRAVENLGTAPVRSIYVGNSLNHDVAGAHAAGLDAVWVRGDQSTDAVTHAPEYVVESVSELLPPPWEQGVCQ